MATYNTALTPTPVAGKAVPYTWFTQLRDSIIATRQYTPVIYPAALAANTNDWNPTDATTGAAFSTSRVVVFSCTVPVNLTGLQAVAAMRTLLQNGGAQNLTFVAGSGLSLAANRFVPPGNVNLVLNAGDGIELWYDSAAALWRFIGV